MQIRLWRSKKRTHLREPGNALRIFALFLWFLVRTNDLTELLLLIIVGSIAIAWNTQNTLWSSILNFFFSEMGEKEMDEKSLRDRNLATIWSIEEDQLRRIINTVQ
jgi:hypothetical protein